MIGLHIHTTASLDGQHWPREIFEMTRDLKLEAIAFADHSSVGSVEGEGLRGGSYELVERLKWEKMARDTQAHGILRKRRQP